MTWCRVLIERKLADVCRPVVQASSVLGTQQSRCSSLPSLFSPEDGSRTTFRNVVILILVTLFSGGWKKSKNPLLHNIVHHRQNLLEFIKTCIVFKNLTAKVG
jgi:hypothetical protein